MKSREVLIAFREKSLVVIYMLRSQTFNHAPAGQDPYFMTFTPRQHGPLPLPPPAHCRYISTLYQNRVKPINCVTPPPLPLPISPQQDRQWLMSQGREGKVHKYANWHKRLQLTQYMIEIKILTHEKSYMIDQDLEKLYNSTHLWLLQC